jgi:hypothetical protein
MCPLTVISYQRIAFKRQLRALRVLPHPRSKRAGSPLCRRDSFDEARSSTGRETELRRTEIAVGPWTVVAVLNGIERTSMHRNFCDSIAPP